VEESLFRGIDMRSEDVLERTLRKIKKTPNLKHVREEVIHDAQAVLLTIRALTLCREAAHGNNAQALQEALQDSLVLELLEQVGG